VMFVVVSAWKRCSVRLYLQLFVGGLMSYLRYLCLFAHSGVQSILCCVFVLFVFILCFCFVCFHLVYPVLSIFLYCPFLIALSVFSNAYLYVLLLPHAIAIE